MIDPITYQGVPIEMDPTFPDPEDLPEGTHVAISQEAVDRWTRAEKRIGRPLRGFAEILGAMLNEDWSP